MYYSFLTPRLIILLFYKISISIYIFLSML
nr:MAG TPA: hypothetical protein [Caudoviricetes sp.]